MALLDDAGVMPRNIERASLITVGSSGGLMLGPGAPTGLGVVGGGKVSAALMVGRSVNARRHDVRKLVKVRAFFVPIKENTRTLFPSCEDVFGKCPSTFKASPNPHTKAGRSQLGMRASPSLNMASTGSEPKESMVGLRLVLLLRLPQSF